MDVLSGGEKQRIAVCISSFLRLVNVRERTGRLPGRHIKRDHIPTIYLLFNSSRLYRKCICAHVFCMAPPNWDMG